MPCVSTLVFFSKKNTPIIPVCGRFACGRGVNSGMDKERHLSHYEKYLEHGEGEGKGVMKVTLGALLF
jgi:hypothetical protein